MLHTVMPRPSNPSSDPPVDGMGMDSDPYLLQLRMVHFGRMSTTVSSMGRVPF